MAKRARCALLAVWLAALIGAASASAQDRFGPRDLDESEIPIALLVDASNGQVLFERAPERRFVPASITKVMTLYTAFDLIAAGRLDLRQSLRVSPVVALEWRGKGSSMFLDENDRVALPDLLTGIATVSANDGAVVLAERAAGSVAGWTALMNARARAIGMTQSHFATPNGWPDEGRTFTTARDLVILATRLVRDHPDLFARFIGRSQFRYGDITQFNRDPLIGRFEGADGIKTGYTNEAGFGYLGTARRGGQRLMLVIAGAPRSAARAKAARSLMEWGFAAFERKTLFDEGVVVGSARVQNGGARIVELVTDRRVAVNVPRLRGAAGERMRMTISYTGPLRAPIAAGEQVAMLEIAAPGIEPARVPLFARKAVAQAGLLDRIANAFAEWLG